MQGVRPVPAAPLNHEELQAGQTLSSRGLFLRRGFAPNRQEGWRELPVAAGQLVPAL